MTSCPICQIEYEDDGLRYCSRCGSDIRARPSADGADAWLGRVVDGRYRVQARIGTGGMGAVYRVEHVRMGKVAAMKVLHRELAGDEAVVKRFHREVEVVSRLNHPNIVQTFDFGYWDGLLYLIMEYVRGEDLAAIIKREGPQAAARALPLAVQVCRALDEAHHLGVIHRDLKPENIVCMRRRDEEVAKVLDFGLAKLRERPELGEITGAGHLVGTPYFMSPEQVRSEPIDHRSDIYSLGATIYRMLTGCFPFEGTSPMGIMTKHLTDKLVPPSARAPNRAITAEMDRVVLKAMARARDDRYSTAAALRRDLEALMGVASGERASAPPAKPALSSEEPAVSSDRNEEQHLDREDVDEFERAQRRRQLLSSLVMVVLLFGLSLAGWATWKVLRPRPATSEKEPNDIPALASPLVRGRAISGLIGKPRPSGEPDFDCFRVPAGPGTRALTASVTGVPDLDLVLEVYDDAGRRIVKVNGAGPGAAEELGPVAIGPGESFVRVRPYWDPGDAAPEGSSTPYALTVDWGPPRSDLELEPNDTPLTANKIDGEVTVQGHLSAPDDEDWFVIRVPPGMRVAGTVEGIPGLDLAVLVGEQRKHIDSHAPGEAESFVASPGKDGLALVGIAEQPPRKTAKRAAVTPERDKPYRLMLSFRSDR